MFNNQNINISIHMSAEVPRAQGWKVYGDRAVGHHIIRQQRLCDTLIADTQMGHSAPLSIGNTDMETATSRPDLW